MDAMTIVRICVSILPFLVTSLILVGKCDGFGLNKLDTIPREYNVSLDVHPEQRWNHVMKDFQTELPELQKILSSVIPSAVLPLVERLASNIDDYLPQPFAGEIKGIAKALNATLGTIVLGNLIYDFSAFCTSIVAQNSQGQIWHARNMDYPFTEFLRKVTIVVNYQRAGKTVYSGVTFAALVGIITGQRPHGFSISMDQRDKGSILFNLLEALLNKNANVVTFLIRQTLEEEASYTAAVARLSDSPTIAPVYYIMGGVKIGEGAVITQAHQKAKDVWKLAPDQGRWFLVETNYDHWNPPPKHDDRRGPANRMMQALGPQNTNGTSLYKVLSTPPLLRAEGITVYTSVMSAAHPEDFYTRVRHSP